MKEIANLAYTAIRCIDEYNLDKYVGLGKSEPKIWLTPSSGQIFNPDNTMIAEMSDRAKTKLSELKKLIRT